MKIGFFGGAFDPFHEEHKKLVLSARRDLGLDLVVVYPSFQPPHKSGLSPFEARKEMAEAALRDVPYAVVDDVERARNADRNPTCEILPLLTQKYPADEHYLLIGGDSLQKFSTWICPDRIVKQAKLAVLPREGREEAETCAREIRTRYGADVILLSGVGKAVASSVVRAKMEFRDPVEGISEETRRIAERYGLYAEHAEMIRILQDTLSPKRYLHVKGVTYYAMKLNVKIGLPYEKVFVAAALHDCAKPFPQEMEGVPAPVVHQFTGAFRARDVFGVTDEEILDAIRYHTTGKPNMTTLGKLIFCADMLEEGRSFDGVETLRAIIEKDPEEGFVACVNRSYEFIREQGNPIYPLTESCVKWYNKRKTE